LPAPFSLSVIREQQIFIAFTENDFFSGSETIIYQQYYFYPLLDCAQAPHLCLPLLAMNIVTNQKT
jgi:hypothetical protein